MEYDKLIRDGIPNIILGVGKKCVTRVLNPEEYRGYLQKKLQEEVEEFLENQKLEELSDILEVVYALAEERGVSPGELETLRLKKKKERGGFNRRLLLLEVQE